MRRYGKEIGWKFVVCYDADGQMDVADMVGMRTALLEDSSLDLVL